MTNRLLLTVTAVAALGAGLNGGVFFAFSTFVMQGLDKLPPAQSIRAMQGINVAAPTPAFMSLLVGTAAVSVGLAVTAVARIGEPWAPWLLAGAALYLVAIVLTGTFHVPRNDALNLVDPAVADAGRIWGDYLSSWVAGNHARTLVCVASAACFLAGMRVG
ncbi:MAG TPA: anthrone oxygenase family protein [Acidimicrobiales bacterium]|nr:anthrone oxygenase family protein [Acidimicrobiales bacterium]